MKQLTIIYSVIAIIFYSCSIAPVRKIVWQKPAREDKNGWIYLHAEGSPTDIGYQHGYLLANDIDTSIQAVSYLLAA